MSNGLYILKRGKPVACPDIDEWAKSFDDPKKRIVMRTYVHGILVSTVFLGVDHAFGGGSPLLFETMLFNDGPFIGGELEKCVRRYASREIAIEGHKAMVESVRMFQKHKMERMEPFTQPVKL